MDARWLRNIKSTGQLSIFPGSSLTASWAKVFSDALREFNKLSSALSLGVTLTRGATKPTPALTGANVHLEATDRAITFDSFVGPVTITIGGSGTSGRTKSPISPSVGRIGQSFICVPLTPQVLAPGGQLREAGDPIKLVILVHEFIHACGLDDHTSMGDPDLFIAVLSDVADVDPAKDKEDVGSGKKVPPLFLANQTMTRIQSLWLVPDPVIHIPHTF
jgi:hypothetical protein